MPIPTPRSTKSYEVEGAYDFWSAIDVAPVQRLETREETEAFIKIDNDQGVKITAPRLSFRKRLGILFSGNPIPFECARTWVEYESPENPIDLPVEELERKATRAWALLSNTVSVGKLPPTPKEQSRNALKLVAEYKRTHSKELIEAIKALPPSDEVRIKLPRGVNLSYAEKKQVIAFVRKLVRGEKVPVEVKF